MGVSRPQNSSEPAQLFRIHDRFDQLLSYANAPVPCLHKYVAQPIHCSIIRDNARKADLLPIGVHSIAQRGFDRFSYDLLQPRTCPIASGQKKAGYRVEINFFSFSLLMT